MTSVKYFSKLCYTAIVVALMISCSKQPANEIWFTTSPNGEKQVLKFDHNLTTIDHSICSQSETLYTISLPEGVTTIDEYAFEECKNLTSISIPTSVTKIGKFAFAGCEKLTSITIPNGVTSIEHGAFAGCSSLPIINGIRYADSFLCQVVDETQTKYTIEEGTRFIGSYAFTFCEALTEITLPNGVLHIAENAFRDCDLTNITIPTSVKTIDNSAFENCLLTSITIPEGITTIKNCTFADCCELTNVIIPTSVTTIESYAFSDCEKLVTITIPQNVTLIGEGAFNDCTSLNTVYCQATTPPTAEGAMFNSIDTIKALSQLFFGGTDSNEQTNDILANLEKIYVPIESVDAYKAAEYWKEYAEYIEGYKF